MNRFSVFNARRRLLARIERGYAVVQQRLEIGGLCLDFTRVADPDVVLDQVAGEADRVERVSGKRAVDEQLHLPYWAELWDSAMGVGRWIAGNKDEGGRRKDEVKAPDSSPHPSSPHPSSFIPHPSLLAGNTDEEGRRKDEKEIPASLHPSSFIPHPSLLDLGCGMGLAGTVAAAVGYDVTFADLEAPALLFARLNSLPFAERVKDVRRLNWQTDRLGRRFDVIVGADILYERKQWDFLEPFWRTHLAPNGRVLLGEPGRQTGELFGDWILSRGWKLVRHEQKVETREKPIRIFEIRE